MVKWEEQFYKSEVAPDIFNADIDTTFALYRPDSSFQCWGETIRTGAPYFLRHMPWYENDLELSEESSYYLKTTSPSSSWYKK